MTTEATFLDRMRAATRLTRAGDLRSATQLIQRALAGRMPVHDADARSGDVVDVEAREVVEPQRGGDAPAALLDGLLPRATPVPPVAPPVTPTVKPATPEEAPRSPRGRIEGQVLRGRHTAAGLTRDYRLYVPPQRDGRVPSMLVMLHGCTQDADDFAAGTGMDALAAEHGFCVLYPTQSAKANPNGCWNWFKHSHQSRGRGEPALLASLTAELVDRHGVDAQRVYVAGLSAGGAMALVLGENYPELFAAIGVHSGLPRGSAHDVGSALQAMNQGPGAGVAVGTVPTIVFHGDADTTVHPRNGLAVASHRRATLADAPQVGRAAAGRSYTRSIYRDALGREVAEHWVVHGAGHAWSGGRHGGSHVDPRGPDASREMLRFFAAHRLGGGRV